LHNRSDIKRLFFSNKVEFRERLKDKFNKKKGVSGHSKNSSKNKSVYKYRKGYNSTKPDYFKFERFFKRGLKTKIKKNTRIARKIYKRTRLNKNASKVFPRKKTSNFLFLKNMFRSFFGIRNIDTYKKDVNFVDLKKAKKKSKLL